MPTIITLDGVPLVTDAVHISITTPAPVIVTPPTPVITINGLTVPQTIVPGGTITIKVDHTPAFSGKPMLSIMPHSSAPDTVPKYPRQLTDNLTQTLLPITLANIGEFDVRVYATNDVSSLVATSATVTTAQPVTTPVPSVDLPGETKFLTNMVSYGRVHGKAFVTGLDAYGNPINALVNTYYDALDVYLRIHAKTKADEWLPVIAAIRKAYRDEYVMRADLMGNVPGYWNFTNGFTRDWMVNKDEKSKAACVALSKLAAYAPDYTPVEWLSGQESSRELAYTVRSYLNAEKLGEPRRARLAPLVEYLFGHIDKWFVSKTARDPVSVPASWSDGLYYIQPFMVGLTMEALVMWYDASQDPRVLPAIKTACDWLWDNAWVELDQSFWYEQGVKDPSVPFNKVNGAPDLSLLIAPSFAYVALHTKDMSYRDKADKIFIGGVNKAFLSGSKQFNQSYCYGFDYLDRRRAVSA